MVFNMLYAIWMFIVNNHIVVVASIIVFRYLYDIRKKYVTLRETDDDWFEEAMYQRMIRKHGSRHRGFVNTPIRPGRDKSMVYPNENGGYTRKFVE